MQPLHRIRIYEKKRNKRKLQNPNIKANPTNTKKQNQISILLYNKSILKLRTKGTE